MKTLKELFNAVNGVHNDARSNIKQLIQRNYDKEIVIAYELSSFGFICLIKGRGTYYAIVGLSDFVRGMRFKTTRVSLGNTINSVNASWVIINQGELEKVRKLTIVNSLEGKQGEFL